jgi:hypothetical protein
VNNDYWLRKVWDKRDERMADSIHNNSMLTHEICLKVSEKSKRAMIRTKEIITRRESTDKN